MIWLINKVVITQEQFSRQRINNLGPMWTKNGLKFYTKWEKNYAVLQYEKTVSVWNVDFRHKSFKSNPSLELQTLNGAVDSKYLNLSI